MRCVGISPVPVAPFLVNSFCFFFTSAACFYACAQDHPLVFIVVIVFYIILLV